MKEQKLVLNNLDSFELEHIFDCGQCFRWNKQEDGSYVGVIKSGVLRVSKNKNMVVFDGILEGDINSIVYDYFDLGTNYDEIKREFSKIDDSMKKNTNENLFYMQCKNNKSNFLIFDEYRFVQYSLG